MSEEFDMPKYGTAAWRDLMRVALDTVAVGRATYLNDADSCQRSGQRNSHNRQAMGLRTEGECAIMRRHDERHPGHLLPQESCREMDRIEGAELRGHGLCRTIEDNPIDFDELERGDESQDRRALACDRRISELGAQPEAIQGTQTLGLDQCA